MRIVVSAIILLGCALSLSAAPLLVEAYQQGQITIPPEDPRKETVVELTFSVDSSYCVQFAVGGLAKMARVWLELDGDSLPPAIHVSDDRGDWPIPIIYTYCLDAGSHTLSLRLAGYLNLSGIYTTCKNAYLQALIFLPDTTSAVAEQPTSDAEPSVNTPSLISKGPYVNVQDASELVDASGRIIEGAIENDKVYISTLPTGTYFARDGDRTIVKIVKVD